ncbi:MAG TPA: endonuclease III domain-containing protein [bacterium]|nr:endonuclease III domain-containing protein [bacterium]HQG47096.1 endonuclease III domain-containing protein [bacterium]HQI49476.1 endonuclease III domain-containing protein [bacterium]HQJ65191.1 endonuclease III domain-containing protein [bacterium]
MNTLLAFYHQLLACYGPQGWWPLLDPPGESPSQSGSRGVYHPGNYDLPATPGQRFEICLGAILTQNTAWRSVEKALINLQQMKALRPEGLEAIDESLLKEAIRPSGYFNQKAKKIRTFARFFLALEERTPSREELLALWGIGPETADSMLLYAFKVPTFVVDAYTRRVLIAAGWIGGTESYDAIKSMFENQLPRDLALFQEYHALLVEHAKNLRGSRQE